MLKTNSSLRKIKHIIFHYLRPPTPPGNGDRIFYESITNT